MNHFPSAAKNWVGAPMKVASSFHPPVLLAFGTTILSLVLVSAVPYRSYTRSRQSDGWIRQTHDVFHHLDDVLAATESAESKSRGFVLTGEPFYLEAYRLSVVRTQQEETILRTLAADNRELQGWSPFAPSSAYRKPSFR
jgi:CHASE3 domain sensor protein